jgi:hypothetical protein
LRPEFSIEVAWFALPLFLVPDDAGLNVFMGQSKAAANRALAHNGYEGAFCGGIAEPAKGKAGYTRKDIHRHGHVISCRFALEILVGLRGSTPMRRRRSFTDADPGTVLGTPFRDIRDLVNRISRQWPRAFPLPGTRSVTGVPVR